MTPANLAHLQGLYAETDDPWNFRGSPYEAERFVSVAQALPRQRYDAALEIGCGNGELARCIAPRCASYTGIDAVPAALDAARIAVPSARFVEGFMPCRLPEPVGQPGYDLVLLSEILYFLDPSAIARIAEDLDRDHPAADIVTVAWRGETGHALSGEDAIATFIQASRRRSRTVRRTDSYRIDVFTPPRERSA
ncbi:methyltransferase domain-containing protein [Fulvimarina endophytica]|uniref:Methyltransferase domain-containing protein n=1 Tax=Fulvimarina endophytica TaxID=2293836 RepID=A0A371X9R7_9HYPH|nr:SAM-dependent methyltransferase [Fulvimarina endophytica]RFC65942.1 methyltransferase domain-containing protein [Fulvimarina endophytica]